MVLLTKSSTAFHSSCDELRSGMLSIRLLPATTARSEFSRREETDEEALVRLSAASGKTTTLARTLSRVALSSHGSCAGIVFARAFLSPPFFFAKDSSSSSTSSSFHSALLAPASRLRQRPSFPPHPVPSSSAFPAASLLFHLLEEVRRSGGRGFEEREKQRRSTR